MDFLDFSVKNRFFTGVFVLFFGVFSNAFSLGFSLDFSLVFSLKGRGVEGFLVNCMVD